MLRVFIAGFIVYMSLYFLRTIDKINDLIIQGDERKKRATLLIFYGIFTLLNIQVILHQVLSIYRLVVLNIDNDADCGLWYIYSMTVLRLLAQFNQFVLSLFIPVFIMFLTNNLIDQNNQSESESQVKFHTNTNYS